MIDAPLLILVIATALASGMMGGAFYAFSAFVMAGLERLPSAQGMAAMQSINVTAVMPGLMSGFFGTTVLWIAVRDPGLSQTGADRSQFGFSVGRVSTSEASLS